MYFERGQEAYRHHEGENRMTFAIKKAKIDKWGYEITAKGFHNIAPSVEAAVNYLEDRYGLGVKYRVCESK